MSSGENIVEIASRDYWFKVVDFLQQNWALIDKEPGSVIVYFVNDASGVFDRMPFPSVSSAEKVLIRNGFQR